MRYGQSKGSPAGQNFQNLSTEQRQQLLQQFRSSSNGIGFAGPRNGTGGQTGGGFVSGEIITMDDKSITVKLRDGGSKIVFFSGATNIGKITDGTADDLGIGKQVTLSGSTNSDGSITAQNIQIRPEFPAPGQNNSQ